MMASDCEKRWPSCTSVGTRLCGFTSRYAAAELLAAIAHQIHGMQWRTAAP